MKKRPKPSKHSLCVLNQICKFIPAGLVGKLADDYGVSQKSRSFTPWSQVVSLLYAQLTHAIGLNDVCDGLRNHAAKLGSIRGASAPSRNRFSHANRTRNSDMMEALFWQVLGSLQDQFKELAGRGVFWLTRAKVNMAVFRALEAARITIPFPQRDVHLIPSEAQKQSHPGEA